MKYFVLIDGQRKETATKKEANALLVDAFLSGVQGIDWNIYKIKKETVKPVKGNWVIVRKEFVKQYLSEFKLDCWVNVYSEYLAAFKTLDDANKAFDELNLRGAFVFGGGLFGCTEVNAGKRVEYLVQLKTI